MRFNFKRLKLPRSAKEFLPGNPTEAVLAANPFSSKNIDRRTRRRYVRWGIISGNVMLLIGVGIFVLANRSASQTIRSGTVNSVVTTASSRPNPLDQLSSAQIALQAAQMTNLPELTGVRNQADSETALLAIVPNDSTVLSKPLVVITAQKSRHDIIHYTAVANDTITSLSGKFHVSTNAIRWSNNLNTDIINAGTQLVIPPAEGIVYQVKAGDSITSIVNKYQANEATFVQVNDAENNNISVGELVWIPNGIQPVIARFSPIPFSSLSGARRFGSCYMGINNGYDCGWCTWWAAYRRAQIGHPVPSNLGNAYTWIYGLPHGQQPQAGAVLWANKGAPGHVGFVEAVNPDGSVYVSDMNIGGWDTVTYRTIPADQATNPRYYSYLY